MGLGPPEIELYRQLKLQGALEGITEVMELGSQDFWCPQKNLVTALGKAFGRDKIDPVLLKTTNASQQPARLLYEAIGIKYGCVDVDGRVRSSSWTFGSAAPAMAFSRTFEIEKAIELHGCEAAPRS